MITRAATRWILLVLGALLGGCSCEESPCPSTIDVREHCPFEDLECPFKIGCSETVCTCTDQTGGLFWDCTIKPCTCACDCGTVVLSSCEALNCVSGGPCPASARDKCELICQDGGVPDGSVDSAPDGKPDVADDLLLDTRPDARDDLGKDVGLDGISDFGPDTTADQGQSDMSADVP